MDVKEDTVGMQDEDTTTTTEDQSQDPILVISGLKFFLTLPDSDYPVSKKEEVKEQLLEKVTAANMGPYYKYLCETFDWTLDEKIYATMTKTIEEDKKKLEEKIEDAKLNLGDTEVREAVMERAALFMKIGDKEEAIKLYKECLETAVGSGARIDCSFFLIRLGLFWSDLELVRTYIGKAKVFIVNGGDWERRNRLGVYEAVFGIMTKDFKPAALKFLDAIATFGCYELFSYNTFIFYTVLTSLVSLDRVTLRTKVVKSPEILSVIHEIPHLKTFVNSLYKCKYDVFFRTLVEVIEVLKLDPLLRPHTGYFMREVRIVGYSQFLTAYRSVTLESMAAQFGVSVPFLDRELSRFIAAGRLNCKIDKVGSIVETNRSDTKNTQYAETIKQGDILLNRIQKLSKVISF